MTGLQLTVHLPGGTGWRARITAPPGFSDVVSHLLDTVSPKVAVADLAALWPTQSAGHWRGFAADCFAALLDAVAGELRGGRLNTLQSGQGLLKLVRDDLSANGWGHSVCQDIGTRLVKIILAAGLAYLSAQFPAITPATAGAALEILERVRNEHSKRS